MESKIQNRIMSDGQTGTVMPFVMEWWGTKEDCFVRRFLSAEFRTFLKTFLESNIFPLKETLLPFSAVRPSVFSERVLNEFQGLPYFLSFHFDKVHITSNLPF